MKYKIAYEGIQIVEIEGHSKQDAINNFWEEGLNDLYNSEILEVALADNPFKHYTDLN